MQSDSSLRTKALRYIEVRGSASVDELALALDAPRRQVSNALSGLRAAGHLEAVGAHGRRRYRVPERRGYLRPPEGRIDIAGPVYARGYRWGSGPL